MKEMYYYPFWLLTSDDGRNAAVADKIEEAADDHDRRLVTECPTDGKDSLRKVMDLRRAADGIYLQLARTRLSAAGSALPLIDHSRFQDAVRRLLSTIRRRSAETQHEWTAPAFGDLLTRSSAWENTPALNQGLPVDWNAVAVTRLSDIHRNFHDFCELAQVRILQDREPPGDLDFFLRATRRVSEAVADYCRFLRSL